MLRVKTRQTRMFPERKQGRQQYSLGFLAVIQQIILKKQAEQSCPSPGKPNKHVAVLDKALRTVTKLRERNHNLRFEK